MMIYQVSGLKIQDGRIRKNIQDTFSHVNYSAEFCAAIERKIAKTAVFFNLYLKIIFDLRDQGSVAGNMKFVIKKSLR